MAEFDKELYMCKALTLLNDELVQGFYTNYEKKHIILNGSIGRNVNPYTICRNTGIKKNNTYLYENDLLEYSTAFDKGMAMVEFDELRCRYMLRTNLDYSARADIEKYTIKVIGNVALSDDDMKRFAEYSKNQSYTKNVEPECRSKAHINKKSKEFLPK